MEEKRIFIATIDRAEDIDEFCVYGRDCMTRTEAIERMARAKHKYEKDINPNMCDWNDYKERAKDEYYRKPVEAELNALLGEE